MPFKSLFAPASTSCITASAFPLAAAHMRAVVPFCAAGSLVGILAPAAPPQQEGDMGPGRGLRPGWE